MEMWKELNSYKRTGWFCTNKCTSGYNLFPVTEEEVKEFNCTHRVTSFWNEDSKWTSLVKIEGNKVYFLDNEAYIEGEIKYQRPQKIKDRHEKPYKTF